MLLLLLLVESSNKWVLAWGCSRCIISRVKWIIHQHCRVLPLVSALLTGDMLLLLCLPLYILLLTSVIDLVSLDYLQFAWELLWLIYSLWVWCIQILCLWRRIALGLLIVSWLAELCLLLVVWTRLHLDILHAWAYLGLCLWSSWAFMILVQYWEGMLISDVFVMTEE